MRLITLALLALLALAGPSRAQDGDTQPDSDAAGATDDGRSWSGRWHANWSGGAARMELTQTGTKVHGSYPLLGGELDGEAKGRELTGTWKELGRSGRFSFRMAPDFSSFMGQYDNGEWWTGGRMGLRPRATQMDQSTPRTTLRSFLLAGIRAADGEDDELGRANLVVQQPQSLPKIERLQNTQALYQLIDLTTVKLFEIPAPTGDTQDITLTQSGSGATIKLSFQKDRAGKWRIVDPGEAAMAEMRTALLARDGGKPAGAEAYLRLRSPRDTMRALLTAFRDWQGNGPDQARDTLDLSALPIATRTAEGDLAVQFLKQVIDRIGPIVLQEIPDDPTTKDVTVIFRHPLGVIAIGGTGEGGIGPYRFTTDTVASVRDIYSAIGSAPVRTGAELRIPASAFFQLRHELVLAAPALLRRVGALEIWQLIGIPLLILASALLAWLISIIAVRLVHWRVGEHALSAQRHLYVPLTIALAALAWSLGSFPLGLPLAVRVVTDGLCAVVLAAGCVWSGFLLADALSAGAARRAAARPGSLDEISVYMTIFALRAALVVGAFLYIADRLSIPTSGIIAGLGISGLAVAFASRETLSNVFGAVILMMDRPFRRGDSIVADGRSGTVEHVGIRSTRIRTAEDSLIVVPNGKLSDATIDNLGSRRTRRVTSTLVLPYAAGRLAVDNFVNALGEMLRARAGVVAEKVDVGINALTGDGYEVGISLHLDTSTGREERVLRQALLLDIVRLGDVSGMPIGKAHVPEGEPEKETAE